MGIFNWLRSRKKNEDDSEEQAYNEDLDDVKTEVPPWSRGYEEKFQQRQNRTDRFSDAGREWGQAQQPMQQSSGSNEIILAKLDVISAKLDNLNQRLANLERYAVDDEKDKSRARW